MLIRYLRPGNVLMHTVGDLGLYLVLGARTEGRYCQMDLLSLNDEKDPSLRRFKVSWIASNDLSYYRTSLLC